MAIFPFSNAYVINKDVLVGSSFKAGMVLMQDSNGQVKPADSQLLVYKSVAEKQLSIIGIAAGDSNIIGNTIIVPDYIGSNYLDSNSNFVSISDREYVSVKRQLLDYADETVNEYYNINYSPKPKRRGIGVYPLSGDTFATDQFSPVLHGDYGFDGTNTITFSPGDLLTIGGGINAGKLVKVNQNSFGPEVLVVGIVDKFLTQTGLLHFRQIQSSLNFGSNPYILSVDPGNRASFSSGSTTTFNLASSSNTGTLLNGTGYSSTNGGVWVFDGIDDGINTAINIDNDPIGIHAWIYCNDVTSTGGRGIVLSDNGGWDRGLEIYNSMWGVHTGSPINQQTFGSVSNNTWYNIFLSYVSNVWTLYVNGVQINTGASTSSSGSLATIGRADYQSTRIFLGYISQVNIYNRGLTATQITNYYNATKSRYGL